MKAILIIAFLILTVTAQAVTYQEFYVQTTGSNLNAGDTATDAATATFSRGSWDASTGVFTPEIGNTTGATVGAFASIYLTGATQTGFVARITAVSSTQITVSLTAKSGTAPVTTVGGIVMKVGGAWAGPSGTASFPFGFYSSLQTNAAADTARINFKAATYSITAAMVHTLDGKTIFQGYTTTAGDGGKAIIDGGTSGSYYNLLRVTAGPDDTDSTIADFIFQNNGSTGSSTNAHGLWLNSGGFNAWRCVARNIGGHGFLHQGRGVVASCEAYNCATNNSATQAGFASSSSGSYFWFCISHHNTGSNVDGFRLGSTTHTINCISWANGRHGFNVTAGSVRTIQQCDAYANGGAGLNITNTVTGPTICENSNFVFNGGAGIDVNLSVTTGVISNCGFGAGSSVNGGGSIAENYVLEERGTVTYTNAIPWSGAATGNFTITLAGAKNAGRGAFVQSDGGTTAGTPDIGAAFAADSGGGGGGGTTTITVTTGNATTTTVDP